MIVSLRFCGFDLGVARDVCSGFCVDVWLAFIVCLFISLTWCFGWFGCLILGLCFVDCLSCGLMVCVCCGFDLLDCLWCSF